MFMGIGNLTELTEADTTGVNALLIGFCQELGIRNVLTTEVIDWARGAVHEAVLAAQLMHFAHRARARRPKHVDGRLVTVKDEEFRPYAEAELRELHAQVTDPNFRIFADADWIYVVQRRPLRQGHRLQRDLRPARGRRGDARLLPRQGADEGDDRARPAQELPPGVAARLGLHDVRRAAPRARAAHGAAHATRRRGGNVKKILIQLDTDEHPSTFDAIVAHDADVDVLLSLRRHRARRRCGASCSRRSSPAGPRTSTRWRSGSAARAWAPARRCSPRSQKAFFGPFRVSAMLDSNGCNTTAATTVARLAEGAST